MIDSYSASYFSSSDSVTVIKDIDLRPVARHYMDKETEEAYLSLKVAEEILEKELSEPIFIAANLKHRHRHTYYDLAGKPVFSYEANWLRSASDSFVVYMHLLPEQYIYSMHTKNLFIKGDSSTLKEKALDEF